MSLPVLRSVPAVAPADLLRYMGHLQVAWSEHLGDMRQLGGARLFIQPNLSDVADANCVYAPPLLAQDAANELAGEVEMEFARSGAKCLRWSLSGNDDVIAEVLRGQGYHAAPQQVLHLAHRAAMDPPAPPLAQFKIIPARAGYRQVAALASEQAMEQRQHHMAEAALLHLDDGHYEALLALSGTTPVGLAGVFNHGEIGAVQQLFVSGEYRRRGVGTFLLGRALEICARAQHRHVLICIDHDNSAALACVRRFGFAEVGAITNYLAH